MRCRVMGKILILKAIQIISIAVTLNIEQLIKITLYAVCVIQLIDISVIVVNMDGGQG